MPNTYSLAVYAITINKRGNKNDLQVLSDFNNGQDFLNYIYNMMNGWKMDVQRGDQFVPVNNDGNNNAFRLSRDAQGQYYFYPRGRYLSGIVETGEYGTQEEGVNITTGEVVFHKNSTVAIMKPFYFLFYIPEESRYGFLIVEKIGNYGIMTILNNAINNYFRTTPSVDNYVLTISPLSINELVRRKMHELRYETKKIELRKIRREDLRLSRLSGNTVNDENVTTSIVYTARPNSFFNVTDFITRIRESRNDDNSLFVIEEDLSCDDITVTVSIGGRDKVISMQNIQSLGMAMDITNSVQLGENRYPTFNSINTQANQLVSYIQSQFNIER